MREENMHLRRFANFWIMLLVATGLVLAPLAVPVMAKPMSDVAASAGMQAMADDMPCCPDQGKAKECDGCPFVALCMLGISLPAPSGAAALIERYPLRAAFAPIDDLLIDGLGAKPPDHPPRTNV
jgi:hypothetical protein